jgi:hypothetical protein
MEQKPLTSICLSRFGRSPTGPMDNPGGRRDVPQRDESVGPQIPHRYPQRNRTWVVPYPRARRTKTAPVAVIRVSRGVSAQAAQNADRASN